MDNEMRRHAYYEYIEFDGEKFFTVVLLPQQNGSFTTVICRSPYVKNLLDKSENDIVQEYLKAYEPWLDRGFAIVYQHCRGQGKSTGAFVPYVHEREDGIFLRQWIRKRLFYNGTLFLFGGSYTASLHYATAPFEEDIKGAVFEVQDSERYRLWYRNGQMRKGHANWHFELYKSKCGLNKAFGMRSFSQLPLKDLSERVLGDRAEDFEQMLTAQYPSNEFWLSRFGGFDAKNATDHANIPILLTTGYNDFYIGGVFKMWNSMDKSTKDKSALIVSPCDHSDGYNQTYGLAFPNGNRYEQFGRRYQIDWFDNILNGKRLPYEKGVITYYRAFENTWRSDFYSSPTEILELGLGRGSVSFCYDPLNPPTFRAEGNFQDNFDSRVDVVSLYTDPFEKDVFIRGQMKAKLTVSSSCPDSAFYVSIAIQKPQGDYVLRHDITSLCYQLGDYTSLDAVALDFCFDEYAFLIKKGERLRIDVSSTDNSTYVCHTNKKGAYYLQSEADKATNTVFLDSSKLFLPIETNE